MRDSTSVLVLPGLHVASDGKLAATHKLKCDKKLTIISVCTKYRISVSFCSPVGKFLGKKLEHTHPVLKGEVHKKSRTHLTLA